MAETTEDFGEAIFALASAEINKTAEKHLTAFGDVQKQIQQVHSMQARSDVFYLANTIDEYIRLIGSIRVSAQDTCIENSHNICNLECFFFAHQSLSDLANG